MPMPRWPRQGDSVVVFYKTSRPCEVAGQEERPSRVAQKNADTEAPVAHRLPLPPSDPHCLSTVSSAFLTDFSCRSDDEIQAAGDGRCRLPRRLNSVHFLEPLPTAERSSYIVAANQVKACSPTHLGSCLQRRWGSTWVYLIVYPHISSIYYAQSLCSFKVVPMFRRYQTGDWKSSLIFSYGIWQKIVLHSWVSVILYRENSR
jgi:hypothetical protein